MYVSKLGIAIERTTGATPGASLEEAFEIAGTDGLFDSELFVLDEDEGHIVFNALPTFARDVQDGGACTLSRAPVPA